MDNSDLQHELHVAANLARQAGALIMDYYRASLVVDRKAGDEPVTAADRAADALILSGLRSAFPADGTLTEESDDDLSRLEKDRVWIVDPLDGTTEFLSHTGEFSVQVALARCGQPVLGVVYQPAFDRLLFAREGRGAYEVCRGQKRRLQVSLQDVPADMCMVASRSHCSPLIEAARQALGIRTLNHVGSVGVKVSLVARGDCDLYLATTVSKEWDLCAPHALLREAGGEMTDLCGRPLTYNQADVLTCAGLVASNGRIHARIIETLAPLRAQT